jgi:hypothetical protein
MKTVRKDLMVCIIFLLFMISCNENRDHLTFNYIDSVQNAIIEMDTLLHKLPKNHRGKLKYYNIDEDNKLTINGIYIGLINKISSSDFARPSIFDDFTIKEKGMLYSNIKYLYENHITEAYEGECFWQFKYSYRSYSGGNVSSYRVVIAIYDTSNTYNAYFRYAYEIMDRKKNLVLYRFIPNKEFSKAPDYQQIHSPYSKISNIEN